MSTETASIRKRKCIVEHIISGFNSARQAIDFADMIESVVAVRTGRQKFRQFIGSPDTKLAITPHWDGQTVLKTIFLELDGQNLANAIGEVVKKSITNFNMIHEANLQIDRYIVREKPQPQTLGVSTRF